MIPALLVESEGTLQSPLEEVTSLALVNDKAAGMSVPAAMLSASLGESQSVAHIVHNMNDLAGGMPSSLVPEGTAVAVEEEKRPRAGSTTRSDSEDELESINGGKGEFDPDDDEDDEDDEDDLLDWADSDLENLEESYVHSFSSFDLYKDLPWFDEVGPDGQEIRLSQMLADEVWEEELEAEREKEVARINSLDEYNRKVAEMEENASQELAETRSVLEAMPGAEIGTIPIRSNKDEPKYDQTKLDGVSQLWGMPPGELSELQSYEEPPLAPGDDNFDGIAQLYGAGGSSSPSSLPAGYDDVDDDMTSFSGISMLWGDPATNDLDDSDQTPLSTGTLPVRGGTLPIRSDDGADTWAGSAPAGNEVRLSQILADEVWAEELEKTEPPDVVAESYEDVVKYEAEMLEAQEEERLETEAILNAPAFAEYLTVDDDDGGSKSLKATNSTNDELAILEMDLPDETTGTSSDDGVDDMASGEDSMKTVPLVAPRTSPSQVYLTQLSQSSSNTSSELKNDIEDADKDERGPVSSASSSSSSSSQQVNDNNDAVAHEEKSPSNAVEPTSGDEADGDSSKPQQSPIDDEENSSESMRAEEEDIGDDAGVDENDDSSTGKD